METTLSIIVACCVLHNLAIQGNDDQPPIDPEVAVPQQVEVEENGHDRGLNENTAVRTALIRTHFA